MSTVSYSARLAMAGLGLVLALALLSAYQTDLPFSPSGAKRTCQEAALQWLQQPETATFANVTVGVDRHGNSHYRVQGTVHHRVGYGPGGGRRVHSQFECGVSYAFGEWRQDWSTVGRDEPPYPPHLVDPQDPDLWTPRCPLKPDPSRKDCP